MAENKFPTITAEHWRASIARARATPNSVSEQIRMHEQMNLTPIPEPDQKEIFLSLQRWKFLYPKVRYAPRFVLNAPDAMELRWSVYDRQFKVTVAFGASPENAVDEAMKRVEQAMAEGHMDAPPAVS